MPSGKRPAALGRVGGRGKGLARRIEQLEARNARGLLVQRGYTAGYLDKLPAGRAEEDRCRAGIATRDEYSRVYYPEVASEKRFVSRCAVLIAVLVSRGFRPPAFGLAEVVGYPPDVALPEDLAADFDEEMRIAAPPSVDMDSATPAGKPATGVDFEDRKRATIMAGVLGEDQGLEIRNRVWVRKNDLWTLRGYFHVRSHELVDSAPYLDELFELGTKLRDAVDAGQIPTVKEGQISFGDLAYAIQRLGWFGENIPEWSDQVRIGQQAPAQDASVIPIPAEGSPTPDASTGLQTPTPPPPIAMPAPPGPDPAAVPTEGGDPYTSRDERQVMPSTPPVKRVTHDRFGGPRIHVTDQP